MIRGFGNAVMKMTIMIVILLLVLLMLAVPGLLGLVLPLGAMYATLALLARIVAPFQPKDDDDD